MRSPRLPSLLLAALVVVVGGCGPLAERVDEVRTGAEGLAEDVRFCVAVGRTLAALEGGLSVEEASRAADELLAQVPDDLRQDATRVTDGLRRAADGEADALREPGFREAAERLRDRTRARCDPTS